MKRERKKKERKDYIIHEHEEKKKSLSRMCNSFTTQRHNQKNQRTNAYV